MILDLILKTNLKTISDLKIEFGSYFQSDFESENISPLAHLPPESQKEKDPRGEPSRTYENCSIC